MIGPSGIPFHDIVPGGLLTLTQVVPRRPLVLGIALAFAVASWSCASSIHLSEFGAQSVAPDSIVARPSDDALLEAALRVVRVAPRMADVWPGYWSESQPFIFFVRDSAALLVSPFHPHGEFARLVGDAVPDELRGRVYMRRGQLPGMEISFDLDYSLGNSTAYAVEIESDADVQRAIATLFHEAFHEYQARRFTPSQGSEYVDPEMLLDPSFEAFAEVEREILAAALKSGPDSTAILLHEYLAVRWTRLAAVSEEVRRLEWALERSEGSAHLVGHQSASLSMHAEPLAARTELMRQLHESLMVEVSQAGVLDRLIRWRVYGTGAAIGFLLDRMGVHWRAAMEAGEPFESILSRAVNFDSASVPQLLPSALARFDFEDLRARIAADSTKRQVMTFEKFNSLAPARIVIELNIPIRDGELQSDLSFESAGEFAQLDAASFALPLASVFDWKVPGVSIVVRSLPVLYDMRRASAVIDSIAANVRLESLPVRIVVPVSALPAVVHGKAVPSGVYRFDRLHLTHMGLTLSVDSKVKVHVEGEEMVISQRADR